MPANPVRPVPRIIRNRTVSAWSLSVCPSAIRFTRPSSRSRAKKFRRWSRAACSRFPPSGTRFRLHKHWQRQASCQVADELLIQVGFPAPQPVVDVHYRKFEMTARPQLIEQVEQYNGIGASRDGYADPIASVRHTGTSDKPRHPLEQCVGQSIHCKSRCRHLERSNAALRFHLHSDGGHRRPSSAMI